MTAPRRLWLASASPRRRALLAAAGLEAQPLPPDVDDAALRLGAMSPERLVVALAWFKARRVEELLRGRGEEGVLLAADTVCVAGDEIVGKPSSPVDAASILRRFRGAAHRTVTGVCLLDRSRGRRILFHDVATVALGPLDDEAIDAYVASGAWRGKAGGYNYGEQAAAGWPLSCLGDPASVMGLPVSRVRSALESLGWTATHGASP